MRVVVVGSGLLGVAAAWFLRRAGAEVTVLERREGAALETSFANAGMLTPSMADPWNAPGVFWKVLRWLGREDSPMLLRPQALPSMLGWGLRFLANSTPERYLRNTARNARLANYSLATLRRLRDELGLAYDQRTLGTLKVFRSHEAMRHMVELARFLEEHGVVSRVLDVDGVLEVEPTLAPVRARLVGGIHYPGDESGDAHLACRQVAEHAARAGVVFRFGVEVTGLVRRGRRLAAVQTTEGPVEADAFVLAAGSYSPLLARRLGLDLPIRPVKGYSITVPCGDWKEELHLPVVDDDLHLAITPLGRRLRVAGTAEFTGWDTTVRPGRIAMLRRLVEELLPTFAPHLRSAEIAEWAGLRPMSCDGVPILGPTPVEGLFLCTGTGHLGWTLAWGAGRLVADLVTGRTPHLDPADYALARFG
ncbi:D-amino acid dehydrogenase [Inmirania thermothiophila]|uniref:D-amino-acid dehydrogenase n=1 Tax=Inmirania thermothiophila TaxID=1750597 RepID=A0A3N1XSP0_9GAMM|nr:D-amino acid dehydrogenase [Inmirania thermothiophila]ROR29660.1 D-amino-acid dehydrogenase [Inmirania thermothiophila]